MRLRFLRRKPKAPKPPDLSWVGKLDTWDVLAILSLIDWMDN